MTPTPTEAGAAADAPVLPSCADVTVGRSPVLYMTGSSYFPSLLPKLTPLIVRAGYTPVYKVSNSCSDPSLYFVRMANAGTQQMIAHAIGVPDFGRGGAHNPDMSSPSPRVLELLRLADELSPEERDTLVNALVDEEELGEFSPEWRAEIERRLGEESPGKVLTFEELRVAVLKMDVGKLTTGGPGARARTSAVRVNCLRTSAR